jgi:phage gp36-like protein
MPAAQYATLVEYGNLGAKPEALSSISPDVKTAHLVMASGLVSSYISKRYTLPLVSWGYDIINATVAITDYTIFGRRGFKPDNPGDQMIVDRYRAAIAWLRDVSMGIAELVDVVDATPTADDAGPLMESDAPLNWPWPSSTTVDDDGLG